MSRNIANLFFGIFLSVGFLAGTAHADMALSQVLATQGVKAVGLVVKAAAEAAYAGSDDPKVIENELIALLNEAEATGDNGVMTYAIIAVMMAGGMDNLALSRQAVNNSNLFKNHPNETAVTVATAEALMNPSASDSEQSGRDGENGGGENGGGSAGSDELGGGSEGSDELGGGSPNPFDPGAHNRRENRHRRPTPFTPV